MRFGLVFSSLASLALASNNLVARDPSDKSGNTQIGLKCEGETLPNPGGANGAGEGGSGYFQSSLSMTINGGSAVPPAACTSDSPTCNNCIFDDPSLSSPTNVTACWNPPAGSSGCSIEFSYNGYDYNSQTKEDKCGHENSWGPFTDTDVAICYFNF